MAKLSDEQVEKNMNLVKKVIETFPGVRCDQVTKMFEDIGTEFFTAPASSREDFHACYPGGLCEHTIRVMKQLRKLADALAPDKYLKADLDFLGLVHDLGKAGDGHKPYYVPNPSDWHRNKGMLYEVNKEIPYMPVVDRTLYVLQKYGVTLFANEYLAIKLSDGMYEDINRKYAMKEPDLALLLHWADRWASALEKQD